MKLITSLLAIVSRAEQFRKETKKRNGKAFNGFITFDVNEETATLTMTATDGDVHMEEKICLFEVKGNFKFQMHIKTLLNILGCMSERPIEIFAVGHQICCKVVAEIGTLIWKRHENNSQ